MNPPQYIHSFLRKFFGETNRFQLEKINNPNDDQAKLKYWVDLLLQTDPQPTILPHWYLVNHQPQVDWYGIAFDERQLRDLSETFMAFVGPTYSNFRGQRATLNPHHPIEKAVQKLTAGKALKVKGNPKEIWSGLERLQKVQIRRPRRVTELPRPAGRVLRDFYMALQVRDRASAQKELQYLINQHCLDTLNLLFLQVQLLETDQNWKKLLSLPELPKLMQIRRPSAVTQALLTAIYRSELQQFEENNDPKGAFTHFREQIFPNYNPLLTVRAGSKRPEVLKLLMLSAVAGEPPRPALRDELLALSDLESSDFQYLQELATFLSKPTPPPIGDKLEQAEQLINGGEYDRAFTLLSSLSPSAKQVSLLLQCAYELQTLEAESQAISAFYQLEERDAFGSVCDLRTILESSPWNQNYLAQLQGNQPTETTIPNNWLEWLQLVKQTPDWERALYTARQGAEEWDVVQLLTQPGQIREFVQLLPQVKASVLHEALPYLLKSFQSDRNFPRREFSEIYYQFVLILADNTEGGDADLELLNQLVDNLFSLGINQKKYTQLVNQVLQLWTRIASPKKIDWALNFLDLLALYPCPAAQKREEFFHAISETLDRFSRRVEPQQWEIFRSLAKELQMES